MTVLDQVAQSAMTEPPELPRLTVAATFGTYQRIGVQLENAVTAYKAIPDAVGERSASESLKGIVAACEAVIKHANRLLEANR